MKKRLTRGEKWLFASPLLFLLIAVGVWLRQKAGPQRMDIAQVGRVQAAGFSPDSERLVVFNDNSAGSGSYGAIYDLKDNIKSCDLVPQTAELNNLQIDLFNPPAWSPDGKNIAVTTLPPRASGTPRQTKIAIWDASAGNLKTTLSNVEYLRNLSYSRDGKILKGNGIPPALIDAATGKRLNQPDKRFSPKTENVQLNEKLGLIASQNLSKRGELRVVDASSKRVVWQPQPEFGFIYGFEWFGDVLMVYGRVNKRVVDGDAFANPLRRILWDGKTRQILPAFPIGLGSPGGQFSFSPDHRTIAHAFQQYVRKGESYDQHVYLTVWDYRAGRELWRYEASTVLHRPEWSPDGKRLMVLEAEENFLNRLLVFDANGEMLLNRNSVGNLNLWSPDSKKLMTVSQQRNLWGKTTTSHIEILRFDDE